VAHNSCKTITRNNLQPAMDDHFPNKHMLNPKKYLPSNGIVMLEQRVVSC